MTSEQIKEFLNSDNTEDIVLGLRIMGDLWKEIFVYNNKYSNICNINKPLDTYYYNLNKEINSTCFVILPDKYISVNSSNLYLVIIDGKIALDYISRKCTYKHNYDFT